MLESFHGRAGLYMLEVMFNRLYCYDESHGYAVELKKGEYI